jgi:hypothetical protein
LTLINNKNKSISYNDKLCLYEKILIPHAVIGFVYINAYTKLNTLVVCYLPSISMYKRTLQERYVIPMACSRCSHAWNYTGKNQYVATCPLCRTKLSIKKNNRIKQTGVENESKPSIITNGRKSKPSIITKKKGMALQRHPNSALTYHVVKQDELL